MVCATAAAAAAAVCGRVSARPWLSPALPGRKGTLLGSRPRLSLPSPPVAGARHRGAAAESAGQSRPCPGGSRVCRGGSSSGALWAQSDCPTSLPVQGRTDGRRSPATPGAAEPPGRSRAACAEADAAACPARGPAPGWGQPCLARPVPPRLQLSCLGPRLFWVPFQLPVPSVWLCGLLSVAGPACGRLQFSLQAQLSSGSCSRVSALVSGPARGRLQFISMPACGWFQLGCGSGSFQLWLGCSSGSSPLPVPFSTRSFWLQLGLVKTILAFGKVVNQSLS